jgi:hypothetical protein
MEGVIPRYEKKPGFSYALAGLDLPILMIGKASLEDTARARVTTALLGALEIRAKTGKLPDSIEPVPHNWIDPYTDAPLKLRKSGDTIVIYSLGRDGIDSHGASSHRDRKSDDVVARFPPQ